ncbi:MAG: T9SS type A sorting domain-containing protein [Bacteroidales bacterium]|nr:T9SS type A sorting domain-containing protein [Bacteroidales bacterium]
MKHIILFTISCFISGISFSQVMYSETHITITQGATLHVDGDLNISAGEMNLNEGATLSMGNNRTLLVNNGGSLNLLGSTAFSALVTSPGYFSLEVNSGGTIGAQYAIFERMGEMGIHIKDGAAINPMLPFLKSTFQNGIAGGTLLTINNNQTITIPEANFPMNSWGGNYNVVKSVDQGEVTFENAFGGFAGTPFEKDQFNRIFWGDELMTHSIPLPAGWSGLSSFVMPANDNMVSIFDPLGSNFIIAQTMTQAYYPSGGINTIGIWQPQSAYKVKMSAPDVLEISGAEESNKVFGINAGWSLVPVITNQPVNVVSLFAGTSVELVKDVAGVGVYWPAFGINTLGSLLPGKAYYAYLNSSGSVTFPENAKNTWTAQLPQEKHPDHPWNEVVVTGSSHLIVIEGDHTQGLLPGDVIGVFSEQEICHGVAEIIDPKSNFILIANADDQLTTFKDGFDDMELMTFKVYRPSTGEIFDMEVEYNLQMPHSGNFADEGLSAIKMINLSSTGIVSGFSPNINVYPNPTDGLVWISGISDFSKIEVIGSLGTTIMTIVNVGQKELSVDLSDLQSGVYQFKLSGEKGTLVKRVVKSLL